MSNHEDTSLASQANEKDKDAGLLQLIVAGNFDRVKRFWAFIKSFSGYRLVKDYRKLFEQSTHKEEVHMVMQMEETPYFLAQLRKRVSVIQMQTADGKLIEFPLLHTQIIEMLNGMVYIQGKSYDIFADPNDQREVVSCTVVEEQKACERWN